MLAWGTSLLAVAAMALVAADKLTLPDGQRPPMQIPVKEMS